VVDALTGLSYEEAVQWIYDLSKKERSGMRLGLESIRGLCKRVGEPHRSFSSIHVAGTNGKGSVAHMMDAILRQEGDGIGLYTSPHLQTFCERVQVGGRMVTEDEVVAIAQELFPHVEAMDFGPTFFDVTTALAFMHFEDKGVSRAVVEVGLGGRLDSTNVLEDVTTCVISSVGLEHTDVLGDDLSKILWEKASIIKPGSRVVVGDVPGELIGVVEDMARDRKALEVVPCLGLEVLEKDVDGQRFQVSGSEEVYDIRLPLMGAHQAFNAALAVTALTSSGLPVSTKAMVEGLASVKVPGRLEVMQKAPLVLIDGAHNPAAAGHVARTLEEVLDGRDVVLVLGMMLDKDIDGFVSAMAPVVSSIVATRADSDRAVAAKEIGRLAEGKVGKVHLTGDVREALDMAKDIAGKDGVVLVTGSFYVAGEARQVYRPVDHYL
jgi:dihydrofolate synthase/folylpolyglutamate synthase